MRHLVLFRPRHLPRELEIIIVQQRVEEIEGMGWRANHGQVDQALDVSIVVQLLPLDTIHHICKGSDLALCRV